jgi:lysocardiolipin and lysophospholipid acyltransferase
MGFVQWFNVWWSLGYVLLTATTSTLMLLVPAIVLFRPISLSLYSRVTSWIFALWWTSCLFITERLNDVGVRITGDALPLGVPLLIMSNHKCNLDWMFLWSAAIRTGSIFHVGVFRAVAKSEIRVIPIFGWGCKLNGFAYIRRKWTEDAAHMTRWIQSQFSRDAPGWILIFPEGTRYTDENKARSDASCVRDGVEKESLAGEILRPRTKGLALLLSAHRDSSRLQDEIEREPKSAEHKTRNRSRGTRAYASFSKIVDMTIQYADERGAPVPGSALGTRCFGQLARGALPVKTCHVHFETFDPRDVPSHPSDVEAWTMARWRKKAVLLRSCAEHGRFVGEGVEEWETSGGQVSFFLQTVLRVFFVAQGFVCAVFLWYSRAFAAYALVAFVGLAVMCQRDPPNW